MSKKREGEKREDTQQLGRWWWEKVFSHSCGKKKGERSLPGRGNLKREVSKGHIREGGRVSIFSGSGGGTKRKVHGICQRVSHRILFWRIEGLRGGGVGERDLRKGRKYRKEKSCMF